MEPTDDQKADSVASHVRTPGPDDSLVSASVNVPEMGATNSALTSIDDSKKIEESLEIRNDGTEIIQGPQPPIPEPPPNPQQNVSPETDSDSDECLSANASNSALAPSVSHVLVPSASHFAGTRSFKKSSRYHMQTQTTLENLSVHTAKCFIYSWYLVLIVSLALSIPLSLQYSCENICGDKNCTLAVDGNNETVSTNCTRITVLDIATDPSHLTNAISLPDLVTENDFSNPSAISVAADDNSEPFHLSFAQKLFAYFYGHSIVLSVTEEKILPSLSIRDADRPIISTINSSNSGVRSLMNSPIENNSQIFNNPNLSVNITWTGAFRNFTRLNREPVIAINIATPKTDGQDEVYSGLRQFRLNFTLQLERWALEVPNDKNISYDVRRTFDVLFLCFNTLTRCNPVSLPVSIDVSTLSSYKLAAVSIPVNLRESTYKAAISAVFQREGWTIFELTARYIFLILLILQLARFILMNERALEGIPARLVAKRPSASEQRWCMILIVSCIFFVQPFVALDVFEPSNKILQFWKHRYPLYFIVMVLMFLCSLISLTLTSSSSSFVLIGNATLLSIIIFLDLFYTGYQQNWDMTVDLCPNFDCSAFGIVVYSLIGAYLLLCIFMTVYVSNNLGKVPYIASRPRQLALRLVILMFSTFSVWFIVDFVTAAIVYRGVALLAINAMDNVLLCGVAVTFVILISSAYIYVLRPENRVPYHPLDRRWKKVAWTANWFDWYASHGGAAYVFYNEKEELKFWQIQAQNKKKSSSSPKKTLKRAHTTGDSITTANSSYGTGYSSPLLSGYSDSDSNIEESNSSPERLNRSTSAPDRAKKELRSVMEKPMFFIDDIGSTLTMFAVNITSNVNWCKPFFNAETCVDAFNLAWEAYGVNAAKGDEEIEDWLSPKDICKILCCGATLWKKDVDNDGMGATNQCITHADSTASALTPQSSPTSATRPRVKKDSYFVNTAQYGYRTVAIYEKLAVQVVISVMDTALPCHKNKQPRIAVAFRGTDNLANAVQDARFRKTYFDEMGDSSSMWEKIKKGLPFQPRVHTGFLTIWEEMRDLVRSTVRQLRLEKPTAKVLVTGHSLGGGIAVLCAYSLYKQAIEIGLPNAAPVVYTFGMPHAGNSAFQTEYDHKIPNTFRIVNESDAISHFSLVSGKHVGLEIDIDRFGNFIVDPMYLEKLFRPTQGKGFSIRQHSMEGYATSINALLEKNKGFGTCPTRCREQYVVTEKSEGVSNFLREAAES